MDFFSIGIDIGGTNINWGIVDREGHIIQNHNLKTQDFMYLEDLSQNIYNTLLENNYLDKIQGIGIGAPAANSSLGIIENSSNLPWKGIVPIIDTFKRHFPHTKIILENDARAAAWGEKIYGGAQHLNNYAYITLGTGIGCGIILDNKILIGDNQFAGEIGHIIIEKNGRPCGCGRNGCLETYASASGIVKTYLELSGHHSSDITSQDIYLKCLDGDLNAIETFRLTAEHLSFGLSHLMTITGIENIFLFGGPVEAGAYILEPLNTFTKNNSLHLIQSNINIQKSFIKNQNAAILGAAALVHK